MPALFVGHGSPMNAITDNPYREAWVALGARLPRPDAVLCVSAHWLTEGTAVTTGTPLKTIHDFYGFPRELFEVDYTVPDATPWAQRTIDALRPLNVRPDTGWGLDHGTWSVLMHMYPQRDVPVFQLSIDGAQPLAFHLALGRALAALRDAGVMIVGSGNIVHNLRRMRQGAEPFDWNITFNEHIKQCLLRNDDDGLVNIAPLGQAAELAVNSGEHYWPLLYAAGARQPGDRTTLFNDTYEMGSLSMTSVLYEAVPS
ncbi:MAG: 4,5-DOPA dioxygenase extradiol [Betaproteobacteria bacterium]|nr:4,5-DOPA dioxygenase extradiol [Betaproteobacteria bacterium]MDE2046823.1 4,5-DOPA dioxygenase extradiol [Betaproteobacteria bacterium]